MQEQSESQPYPEPRGLCPHCGSAEVLHLLIGMPSGPDAFAGYPEWAVSVGCVFTGENRVCQACDGGWCWNSELGDVWFRTVHDLFAYAGGTTPEQLAEWISDRTELDALVRPSWDEDSWSVGFDENGLVLEFPMTLTEFWEQVNDQEEESISRIEERGDEE